MKANSNSSSAPTAKTKQPVVSARAPKTHTTDKGGRQAAGPLFSSLDNAGLSASREQARLDSRTFSRATSLKLSPDPIGGRAKKAEEDSGPEEERVRFASAGEMKAVLFGVFNDVQSIKKQLEQDADCNAGVIERLKNDHVSFSARHRTNRRSCARSITGSGASSRLFAPSSYLSASEL